MPAPMLLRCISEYPYHLLALEDQAGLRSFLSSSHVFRALLLRRFEIPYHIRTVYGSVYGSVSDCELSS